MKTLVGNFPLLPLRIACALALVWGSFTCLAASAGLTVDTSEPPEPTPPAKTQPRPKPPARPAELKKSRTPAPTTAQIKPRTAAPPVEKPRPAAPEAAQIQPRPPAPSAATTKTRLPAPAAAQTPTRLPAPSAAPTQARPPAPAAATIQARPPASTPVHAQPPAQAHTRPPQTGAPQAGKPGPPGTPVEGAAGTSAPAAGTSVVTQGKIIEHYVELVRHEITGAWHPPAERRSGNPVVSFTVNRAGIVSNVQVTTSSGDQVTDALAVTTLQMLSPFDPLPGGAPESIAIDFTFLHVNLSQQAEEGEDEVFRRRRRARKYPHDGKAAFEYARALRFADRPQESADELRRAMEIGYPKGPCLQELAHAYKKMGKAGEAETYFKQSIKEAPDLPTAHRYLGDLYYEQKRWGDALASYRQFLKLQPSGPVSELANMRIQLCQRRLEGKESADE